ncbi:RNA polymerase sigma factor [Rhodoflexus sp.]
MKILSLGNPFADEDKLVAALQQGSQKAEEYLYKKHKSMVINLILQKGGTADEAEDIYQETILVAMEKISSPDFIRQAQLKTFIYSIAKNKFRKEIRDNPDRKGVPIQTGEGDDDEPGMLEKYLGAPANEDSEWYEEQMQLLRQEMSKIGETCRQLLEAWYERKWGDSNELAAQFGKSSGEALKMSVHKCREKLRKNILPLWNKKIAY